MVGKKTGARKALLAVGGLLALGVLTVAGITAYKPLHLPFIDSYLRSLLEDNYHSYDVEFDETRIQWHLIDGIVELQISAIRARDMGGDIIATLPEIDVGMDLPALVQGKVKLHYLRVLRARFGLFRTAGGAVKFDIGGRSDGSSGKILENLLVDIAAAPALTEGKAPDFPTISVIDTEIELGDEVSGAELWIPTSQIHLNSDPEGVRGDYVLKVATGGEPLRLSAVSLFRTANQRTDLIVELDGVRPAIVGEILPNLGFFTPLEVPFSGTIKVELDKFLGVSKATFDLVGDKGSLEIADYGGTNVMIESVRASGIVSENFSRVALTDLRFALAQGEVAVQGLVIKDGPTYSFALDLAISDTTPVILFPRWFAQIETAPNWTDDALSTQEHEIEVAFDGRYDKERRRLDGTGIISPRPVNGHTKSSNGAAADPNKQDLAAFWFSAQGPIEAPNILVSPIVGAQPR